MDFGRKTAYSLRYARCAIVATLTAYFGPSTILAMGPKYAASGTSRSPVFCEKSILEKSDIKQWSFRKASDNFSVS